MIRLMIVAIALTLALLLMTPRAEGCSCLPRTPAEIYCKSDYAALLKVVDVSEPFYDDSMQPGPWNMPLFDYDIEVLTDFKGNIFSNPLLQASSNDGLCGVSFGNGTYLIMADFAPNVRPGGHGKVITSWSCAFNRYIDSSNPEMAAAEVASYMSFLTDDFSCENVSKKRTLKESFAKKFNSALEEDRGKLSALQEQARKAQLGLQRKVDAGREQTGYANFSRLRLIPSQIL
ncbi:uncharacterized protein LOC128203519 isoform X1 [Mya arenaria]|uniref:uncharacterized protein LOC128203519 isoform X1 n=1 Tax=Mya arenaria TaxID=6604 RepID=UPI0022E837F4|nr:uncharacterized protein LOC128203519 isoform X1 [Mya arenaria]